jgi:hypothetical protein
MARTGLSYRVVPHAMGWHWEIVLDQRLLIEGDEVTRAAAGVQVFRALMELMRWFTIRV